MQKKKNHEEEKSFKFELIGGTRHQSLRDKKLNLTRRSNLCLLFIHKICKKRKTIYK